MRTRSSRYDEEPLRVRRAARAGDADDDLALAHVLASPFAFACPFARDVAFALAVALTIAATPMREVGRRDGLEALLGEERLVLRARDEPRHAVGEVRVGVAVASDDRAEHGQARS